MYESILKQAGLSQKQAQVYLAVLAIGNAKAPEIAKKAGLKRTTAYGIIDELAGLGLLSTAMRGKQKLITAEDPETLLEILDERRKRFADIIPDLASMQATHRLQPKVRFFEGRDGIKRIYDDTLTCKSKKLYQIVRVKDFIQFPGGDYARKYIERRAQKGIKAYALHPTSDDIHNETYGETRDIQKREVRYVPPMLFHTAMIMLYDYKVAMISSKEEAFGFIIESKEFSKTMHAYFDFMWEHGKREPAG